MSTSPNPANANAGKETIYVDVDDEITTIIDKVRGSSQKIVALVLPKRATMLQSVVNMKLLKRTSEDAKKHLVLITTEPGLLPLAGGVGLYVAKNLQSKPEIPEVPLGNRAPEDVEEALSMEDETPPSQLDASKPVGDLAAGSIPPSAVDETIDLGDESSRGNMPATAAGAAAKAKKGGKFKVPNFNRFRLLLLCGGAGIILLIVAWIICFDVLPKATITVKTNASNVVNNLNVTLSSTATGVKGATIPAQMQQTQKALSQQAPATGQKETGAKASGTVQFYNCNQADTLSGGSVTVPAGTGVSANGLTFITKDSVTIPGSHFNGSTCKQDVKSPPIAVVAQNPGGQYNIGSATYTVAGFSNVGGSGSNMTGGTTNIIKIVQQTDIDGAKQKLASQDTAAIKQQLTSAFQNVGLFAIQSTFQAGTPNVTTTANVGDQADNVTVNETVTYTMFGAKKQDLHQLISDNVKKKIDTSKQVLLDDGLDSATFTLQSQTGNNAVVALQDTAVAGPDLKVDSLRTQVAGKKASDAQSIIKNNPGVTDVNVDYSPFWVSAIPKNTSKITIVIEKPSRNVTGS